MLKLSFAVADVVPHGATDSAAAKSVILYSDPFHETGDCNEVEIN